MKTDSHGILRRPVLTEKTTQGIESLNCYVFEVAPDANKITVKDAVEDLFDDEFRRRRTAWADRITTQER